MVVVLVVEKDPLLRIEAADMLTDAGFEVIEAADAGAAINTLKFQSAGIHVIFSDFQLPGGIDGLDLVRYANFKWPSIALILASALPAPPRDQMPLECRFFKKPYQLARMIALVRQLTGTS